MVASHPQMMRRPAAPPLCGYPYAWVSGLGGQARGHIVVIHIAANTSQVQTIANRERAQGIENRG